MKAKTFDVTESFGQRLAKAMDDSNSETDISKAGIYDLCDALSGMDNSKFSILQAKAELERRGL